MRFYSLTKYYKRDSFVGPDPDDTKIKCIYEIDSFAFNGSSLAPPKKVGIKLNRVYYDASICKDDDPKKVTVSEDCKHDQCPDWDMMAGFADEHRVYLIGRSQVHTVENVFASKNVHKKKLTVQTFKFDDVFFFVPENKTIPGL